MITEIQLSRFKGFRELQLPLKQFTNLIGLNSCGKSSALQAIMFVFDIAKIVFGNRDTPDFSSVNWEFNPEQLLNRYTLGDTSAMWWNKETSSAYQVSLKFSDGYSIRIQVAGPTSVKFDLSRDDKSIRGPQLNKEDQDFVQSLFQIRPLLVPPLGATAGIENWTDHQHYLREIAQGRTNENWRNSLYWLYNDGDKQTYGEVLEFIKEYIPECALQPPKLGHGSPARVVIEFVENGQTFDIGLSGSGLRTMLNLAAVLLLSTSRLIMLDEPDAHLHSSLQRSIARMLVDFASERGIQIIVATHAPDFIAETPIESLQWIDRAQVRARPITALGRALIDLGAITETEVLKAGDATSVLFLEGTTDRKLLDGSFNASGIRNPLRDPEVLVAKLPSGKSSAAATGLLPSLLQQLVGRQIHVVCLCDADYESHEENQNKQEECGVIRLKRKEIENYFFTPNVFAKAAELAAECQTRYRKLPPAAPTEAVIQSQFIELLSARREEVRCQLIWQYRQSLGNSLDPSTKEAHAEAWFSENWVKQDWRIRTVPGKQVLRQLRQWCQENFKLSISESLLSKAISPPPDLVQTLQSVSNAVYRKPQRV